MQERGVPAFRREQGSHLGITVIEYHPVEHTVNDITDGSAEYQGAGEHDSRRRLLLQQMENIPPDKRNGHYPEQTQHDFSPLSTKLHPESHTIVLDEMNLKPISDDSKLIPDHHMRLYPDLHGLVQHKKHDDKHSQFLFNAHPLRHLRFFPHFSVYAQCGVRHSTQAFFRNQFPRHPAYPVSLVFYSD